MTVSETTAEMTWTNETALLVIDVQKGVVVDGHDRDGVVSRIAGLVGYAREHRIPVVYVQHEAPSYPPMARGGGDWEICDEVAPAPGEPIIAKQYPDAFAETDLEATLDDLGIRHLVICGAQSDACVRATTYRAMTEGYDVTLVADAHTTSDRPYQGGVIPAEQIITHVNLATPYIAYPGRSPRVVTKAELVAGAPVQV